LETTATIAKTKVGIPAQAKDLKHVKCKTVSIKNDHVCPLLWAIQPLGKLPAIAISTCQQ
jgi:hypothetical protein